MSGPWTPGFALDDEDETELLELSTGFSILEEDPDCSEMLRVLEQQLNTLLVQLDNLEEDLSRLAGDPAQGGLYARLQDQADRLTARIQELESQIEALS